MLGHRTVGACSSSSMCPERSPSLERPQSIGSCIVTKRDGSVVSRQPLSVVTRARVHDEPHSPRARSALAPWCVVAARVVGARSLGCSAFGCMIWSGSPSNVLPLSLARTNDARSLRWSHAVRCRHACGAATSCRNATWLILPVVICLSQRLSHACLSISNFVL